MQSHNKNYITPSGLKKLRKELENLLKIERPEMTKIVSWAASNGDRSENGDYIYGKKKLREIDSRIKFLSSRIDAAVEIDPILNKAEHVQFGASVLLEDEDGIQKTYSIVGVDEVDVKAGKISWKSPLGSSLLKAKVGDSITYSAPAKQMIVEIIKIDYLEIV